MDLTIKGLSVSQGQPAKPILVDLSEDVTEYFEKFKFSKLLDIELKKYESMKQVYDKSDYNESLLNLFISNRQLKDTTSTLVFSGEQYLKGVNPGQEKESEYNLISYLQHEQSSMRRGLLCSEGIETRAESIKESGVGGKSGVQLCVIREQFKLGKIHNKEMVQQKAMEMARQCGCSQNVKLVPIVDIRYVVEGQCNVVLERAREILSEVVFQLQMREDVELSRVMICSNIASVLAHNIGDQLKDYEYRQMGQNIAFHAVRLYYQCVPPTVPVVFFSFTLSHNRVLYHFLNSVTNNMSTMMSWSFGLFLTKYQFDEVYKSILYYYSSIYYEGFSVLQRRIAAQITLNQSMEVLNVALNGKYKDGYELGHVGEIIIGNIK